MTNIHYERVALTNVALKLVPPLIRDSLLNDQSFRKEYGLTTDVMISFIMNDATFQRSVLFDAVRIAYAGEGAVELTDAEDRTWCLTIDAIEGELPNIILTSDQLRLVFPDFSVLSGDTLTRILFFEKCVSDVNLPLSVQDEWRSIMEARSLEDFEFDAFNSDISDTTVHVARMIRNEIAEGKSSVASLVPNSRRYFERLVGAYDGSPSIRDYAVANGRYVFKQLTGWRPYEGFLFSLLLSSHSALTLEININHLDQEELEKAYSFLEMHGDPLSCLGGIEVGLRILPDRPEVEPYLLRLINRIRDDDVNGNASEFKLFSALFVLVDGELARTRLLTDKPPFYRRLASLAHAALIHRQIVQCRIDYDSFSDWAFNNHAEHFYMQSFADMRAEPRWNPYFAAADQMHAFFLGRIVNAGNLFKANLSNGVLRDTFISDGVHSLIKRCGSIRPFIPGPLEGTEDTQNDLPEEFARLIEEHLDSDKVDAASFRSLVNSGMIFRISSCHAELAAKALKLTNHTLANLEGRAQLIGILNGLAMVAAVSRNSVLADELRILVRRYRRDIQYGFSVNEVMKIYLIASAARGDIIEWRESVGDWLSELAFSELEEADGRAFYSHLSALLHSVPELWVSCSRADAALRAWLLR